MKKLVPLTIVVTLALSGCHGSVLEDEQSAGANPTKEVTASHSDAESELPMTLDDAATSDILLIDVRTPEEFASGHVPDAINVPLDVIEEKIAEVAPDKNKPLALYCRSGNRSGQAIAILQSAGYESMVNLGGISDYSGALESGQ